MIELVRVVLWLAAAWLALVSGYLLLLGAAAVLKRPAPPPDGPARRRFAILVPAHDEALLIGRLLSSVSRLDYPRTNFDIHVIADNCHDNTAALARSSGATVHERVDCQRIGKGFALQWGLDQVRATRIGYDAFVVVDADCILKPDFLRRMDARMHAGSRIIQSYDAVLNAADSPLAALRLASFAGYNYLRPLGRSALGQSVGLKGTGMCFSANVLQTSAWESLGVAEDAEFHVALVRAGERVDFAPETAVLSDMPSTFGQAQSQNLRWERGRLALLRRDVPGLLVSAVRERRIALLDVAIEQLIPPLSVPFAIASACVVAALAVGSPLTAVVAGLGGAGQLAYLLLAMGLVRAPRRAYASFVYAPFYVAWKLGIYAQSIVSKPQGWVRTPRGVVEASQGGTASARHHPTDLAVLDAIRGLAALYVMLGHAFHFLVLSDTAEPGSGRISTLHFLGEGLFRWSHEAVLLFFLISGFCIHFRQARARATTTDPSPWTSFDIRSYGRRRFLRLFPPLATALGLTATFDFVGAQLNPAYYAGAYVTITQHLEGASHSVTTLLGNLLFQPSFVVPPFGMNGPLWSLAFEFWFYALYPLVLFLMWRWGARAALLLTGVACIAAFITLPASVAMPGANLASYQRGLVPLWAGLVALYWIVWVWGAVIAEAYVGRFRITTRTRWLIAAAVGVGLVGLKVAPRVEAAVPWRTHDIVVAALLAILLMYLLVSAPTAVVRVAERVAQKLALLGDMSYSLYVVHLPWIVLISAWWLSAHTTLPSGLELFLVGISTSLLLALGSWFMVERHFMTPRSARTPMQVGRAWLVPGRTDLEPDPPSRLIPDHDADAAPNYAITTTAR